MREPLVTITRFAWRATRNFVCAFPLGRRLLFPPQALSQRFGRSDVNYAIRVFQHHYRQLNAARFHAAQRILEVGPGRNLGTALLMWALNHTRLSRGVAVVLWDVFPNMVVNSLLLQEIAQTFLQSEGFTQLTTEIGDEAFLANMKTVADGKLVPDIDYVVQPLAIFAKAVGPDSFDLIYSQAAIEHAWDIAEFWSTIIRLTKRGGWHSHRIDLADHGRRDTNYIEMLEWSPLTYWLTMRFIPGAINRWRASMHLEFIQQQGMKVETARQEMRPDLPVPRNHLHSAFRNLADSDLRTTALDLVAVRVGS